MCRLSYQAQGLQVVDLQRCSLLSFTPIAMGRAQTGGRLSHFFAITAQLMRRILVDHPRSHLAEKRGRGAYKLEDVIAMS